MSGLNKQPFDETKRLTSYWMRSQGSPPLGGDPTGLLNDQFPILESDSSNDWYSISETLTLRRGIKTENCKNLGKESESVWPQQTNV